MDVAYNQHSERARRKNRSSASLHHLTLAPLTSKLPIDDDDEALASAADAAVSPIHPSTSYLQGKSAPTTPRLLSRASPAGPPSRSRSLHRAPSTPGDPIAKSKSATHLAGPQGRKQLLSGYATPSRRNREDPGLGLNFRDRNDSDWLLRTGALMSSEAREFKGQAWLVSRQSSTSLAGSQDADEQALEHELAREREVASRLASRRGSAAFHDEDASPYGSRFPSRTHSRSHSMSRPRSQLLSPLDREHYMDDSYFPNQDPISGPDFVNLDEKLEELEQDTMQDDEAAVRRLMRKGQAGAGTWFNNVIGWSLFSVDEDDEDSSSDESEDDTPSSASTPTTRGWSARHGNGVTDGPAERLPAPTADEGGWKDAAWLLSVASKVMF